MISQKNRPILVTGSHRSGSTWVGQMIAAHPRVWYFSEPFNPDRRDCPVRHMWHYVTEADARQFRDYLKRHCELSFPWWRTSADEPATLFQRLRRCLSYVRRRRQGWRPLLKDPMALMAAEWLAGQYPLQVVVLIRHPAAFASSLKRLNWPVPPDVLLNQPRLMRDYLEPFREELEHTRRQPVDIIDHAILDWRIFHHVIRLYQQRHPDWLFCRHEDLSREPLAEYEKLFRFLGLDYLDSVRDVIRQHSGTHNSAEAGGKIHQLRRNSEANIWNWQTRLTPDEIARIRAGTRELCEHFYGDADWWSVRAQEAA